MRFGTPWAARLAAALLALAAAPAAPAQPRVAAEAELKAAFVYRIALFVEWPAEPSGSTTPFQVCVLGPDAGWSAAFASIEGKKVQGRPVLAARLLARADEARGCQVVVLADGDAKRAAALPASVLTVGDADGFAQAGGMVGFVREGTQLRFDINREAAARAQLRMPAELLKAARAVVDGAGARP
jgi:hypothetical protein